MQLADLYPASAATAPPNGASGPRVSASGSFSQSGQGSVSAEGAPAVWFLVIVGAAFLLLHAGA